jgi:hypothetical protein
MGRHRVVIPHMGNAGQEWSRRYRVEWAVVVGARLRRLRESHGLRLRDIEIFRPDGIPYSSSFFSRLENGWGTPPLWVYVTLAERFGKHPGVLLGPEEVTRPWTDGELTLLRVLRRAGIEAHEAIVRLLGPDAAGGSTLSR